MRLHGDVVLFILVEANGGVSTVKVESGHPILAAVAVDTVRWWKYAPAPDKTTEMVKFNFSL